MSKMKHYVGCSGFHYREWKGLFYPEGLPQKAWLSFYAERFNTLELNNTFYRFPTEASLQKWYRDTPAPFSFIVKAPKIFTHLKKMQGIEVELTDFYAVCTAALSEKLACFLFQFPASVPYAPQMLDTILQSCGGSVLHAFEFRHQSWWREEVWLALQNAGHVFCNVSFPGLPDIFVPDPKRQYLRFHGVPVLYKSGYGREGLAWWIEKIKGHRPETMFALFNNTWYGEAITDARLWRESF